MKLWQEDYTYQHPFDTVTKAIWQKYPHNKLNHVKNVDVFARSVDPKTKTLHSSRLLTCSFDGVPSFVKSMVGGENLQHLVYEESAVSAEKKTFVMRARNVTLSSILDIDETCTYKQHPENKDWTILHQETKVTAGPALSGSKMLERMCVNKIGGQASKGREVLESICEMIKEQNIALCEPENSAARK
eukprot:GFYU01003154.1.p1 GENE.GFYU01003154.1~~GFYU01003154.1.p1  ORF type:complete len:188 (-),score=54.52 GFYU01003154.1:490-1053(-)